MAINCSICWIPVRQVAGQGRAGRCQLASPAERDHAVLQLPLGTQGDAEVVVGQSVVGFEADHRRRNSAIAGAS